ncbi:hypothetical protein H072_10302 [Dactylellina haptotyla CBS 200.50]|uniref:Peptidase S9 prolyl oligopeptidase catalytic domain-containing protein n=1 Tax=Dactylellina haptotyla (strain CBS 200.50) TaxID=1284197 RepID=S8A568_DACHA|nr:hypothetical protein H072_10302 [Dactylellina haptotyla CBS 200.50]
MTLEFFPASKPNKTGVLVLPGGGYEYISADKEGSEPVKWLNERGFDAWILTYTIIDDAHPAPIYPKPQEQAVDAVERIRRENRVTKLGIWGWSAGGHLAAVTSTEPGIALDFSILAYPVISMEYPVTHPGSRCNLIGDDASPELAKEMSAQYRVTGSTPPTFIFHTANDGTVPVKNALLYAGALDEHQRPFKLFILPDGPHGVGLALDVPKHTWTAELERWLQEFICEPN